MGTHHIEIPASIEQSLALYAAQYGEDVDSFLLRVAVEQVSLPLKQETDGNVSNFSTQLREIVAMHPVVNSPIDDSRDSIYEGRGE